MSDSLNAAQLSFDVDENAKTTNAQEQEVNDVKQFLELEYNTFLKYKAVYDVLEEFVIGSHDDENSELKLKVHEIMLQEDLKQALPLNDTGATVLGVSDVDTPRLKYSDSRKLEEIVKERLKRKHHDMLCELDKFSAVSDSDEHLIDLKGKLLSLKEEYVKNLLILRNLLNDIRETRFKSLPDALETKIKEWELLEKILSSKTQLLIDKNHVDVFKETSTTLEAYKELIKDIKKQQHHYEMEIERLSKLKEQYKQVSCKQYDEILQSYREYKASIERRKLLCSQFKV